MYWWAVVSGKVSSAYHFSIPAEQAFVVTFGPRGEALVAQDFDYLLLYCQKRGKYTSAGRVPLHLPTIPMKCRRWRDPNGLAASNNLCYVQVHTDEPTHVYSHTMKYLRTVQHHGNLLGFLQLKTLVYKHEYRNGYKIVLHRGKKHIELQPPGGSEWDKYLSVCRTSTYIVVAEWKTRSLNIFS